MSNCQPLHNNGIEFVRFAHLTVIPPRCDGLPPAHAERYVATALVDGL